MVASCSRMPPAIFLLGFGFMCFLIICTPSTRTRPLSAMTRRTRPFLPLLLPAITTTWSPRLILIFDFFTARAGLNLLGIAFSIPAAAGLGDHGAGIRWNE